MVTCAAAAPERAAAVFVDFIYKIAYNTID